MLIYKYDKNKELGYSMIEVATNHVLQSDELTELPNPCYTPMKLVNGKLVSATLEESDEYYGNTVEKTKPSADQLMQSSMLKEIADLKKQVADLTAKVGGANDVSSN